MSAKNRARRARTQVARGAVTAPGAGRPQSRYSTNSCPDEQHTAPLVEVEDDYDDDGDFFEDLRERERVRAFRRGTPGVSDHRGSRGWLLGHVEACNHAVGAAEAHLRQAVEVAREAGATWDDLGDALGVTRQSAARRFGPRDA